MNPRAVKKHILEELAHGKPIQHILNPPKPVDDPEWIKPDLPDWNLVVQWLKDDEEFRAAYEHSMKYGAAYLADEMLMLKEQLLQDPRSATAYKTAMDMIKWATMIRDPKYSERTIQEIKNTAPQDPEVVSAKIAQLREELGIGKDDVVDVVAKVVEEKKGPSERQLEHLRKARAALEAKRNAKPDSGTGEA
jgi:hypothetical protein